MSKQNYLSRTVKFDMQHLETVVIQEKICTRLAYTGKMSLWFNDHSASSTPTVGVLGGLYSPGGGVHNNSPGTVREITKE